MKYLIVSADDFGLTSSVNEGIVKARKDGIVTNLNLLPTGQAYEDALGRAEDLKLYDVGAHLSLTETFALTSPEKIPSLVEEGRSFYKSHKALLARFMAGMIKRQEVYVEFKNQLETVRRSGLAITSLSSHEHIHMFPGILEIFIRLAKEYGIPAIRYTCGEKSIRGKISIAKLFKYAILSRFKGVMEKRLKYSGIAYAEHFAGFLDGGKLFEDQLSDLLEHLEDGATELVCHPGFIGPEIMAKYKWHLGCENELYGLTSPKVKNIIKDSGIRLLTYREFLSKPN